VLYEAELPRYPLPAVLERIYGALGFDEPVLYSNFVMSMDGVASLGSEPSAGSAISGRNQPDRFLMGLLRACADAVLVGGGTLRATPGHQWTPEHVFPELGESFADLRLDLGRKPRPRLVLLTASGKIPVSHPAVIAGATVVTTLLGARGLRDRLPDSCDLIELGQTGPIDVRRAVEALHERGYRAILTEGGPHVMGDLVEEDLVDEVFLTSSPILAGRDSATRLGMIAGTELLPGRSVWARLLSVRRHGDFLFLRYGVKKP
jgi:riboflavin biosynthesis pyrimidine reductase